MLEEGSTINSLFYPHRILVRLKTRMISFSNWWESKLAELLSESTGNVSVHIIWQREGH